MPFCMELEDRFGNSQHHAIVMLLYTLDIARQMGQAGHLHVGDCEENAVSDGRVPAYAVDEPKGIVFV